MVTFHSHYGSPCSNPFLGTIFPQKILLGPHIKLFSSVAFPSQLFTYRYSLWMSKTIFYKFCENPLFVISSHTFTFFIIYYIQRHLFQYVIHSFIAFYMSSPSYGYKIEINKIKSLKGQNQFYFKMKIILVRLYYLD